MIGAYGTIIPINIANIDIPNLVDISYCYHETRTYDSMTNANFKHLDSSILTQAKRTEEDSDVDEYVEGMYNLQLPLSEFNKKGFYTVYIKPKEIEAVIADVGSLTAFPNVRGLVLDSTQIKNDSIPQRQGRTMNLWDIGLSILMKVETDKTITESSLRTINASQWCKHQTAQAISLIPIVMRTVLALYS
jgi:hypothetical protein